MSEFVKTCKDNPKIFVFDMSLALINAAARAFVQNANTVDYLNTLFNLHIKSDTSIPPCLIRIDFAHLMNNVVKTESLKNSWKKIKDFYIRCVAILIQKKSLEEARNHICSVLIVAKSETEGIVTRILKSLNNFNFT